MRFLVTAGPTREAIDPVRFLSNRSSGRMGYAVAAAAAARGHETVLISGPVSLAAPAGVRVVRVVSAEQMLSAVRSEFPSSDALVMAAAVADFRPRRASRHKVKKAGAELTLDLERTVDILEAMRGIKQERVVVGFAAETGDPVAEAQRKRRDKGVDLIVANDVLATDAGFEVETNRVILVEAKRITRLPLLAKSEVAERIVSWVEKHHPTTSKHAGRGKIRRHGP
jgi:phosphopantothenoylcysteine decarboxylase/phosphopantothenate--cysteine ligase